MCRVRCRGDSGLKPGPRGGKALYDPCAGDHGNNTGRDTNVPSAERYIGKEAKPASSKQRDIGAIAECIVLHNPELLRLARCTGS